MQNLRIFLALLLGTPTGDAAQLNYNVLARIVSSFREVPTDVPSSAGGGQFSFLMALTPDECEDDNRNIRFIPGTETPRIVGTPRYFLNIQEANYIAVYPDTRKQCSESKILHPLPNKLHSAAKIFANNTRSRIVPVGCVIFYTTYTPCTDWCFSDDQNWCIVEPISNLRFEWPDQNTTKYLVFSKVYWRDTNKKGRKITKGKMEEVARSGFNITKCDGFGYSVTCEPCHSPDYCIDQVTPEYWDFGTGKKPKRPKIQSSP